MARTWLDEVKVSLGMEAIITFSAFTDFGHGKQSTAARGHMMDVVLQVDEGKEATAGRTHCI